MRTYIAIPLKPELQALICVCVRESCLCELSVCVQCSSVKFILYVVSLNPDLFCKTMTNKSLSYIYAMEKKKKKYYSPYHFIQFLIGEFTSSSNWGITTFSKCSHYDLAPK